VSVAAQEVSRLVVLDVLDGSEGDFVDPVAG
jgi:hypothetical protein